MERKRKRELRELNARAWADDKDVFPTDTSLDSSMKRNTAFIKRLRTSIAGSGTSTFLSEIRSLSLQKYLSEIISACFEGLCKVKLPADIAAAVEIFSALHQRFGPDDFTGLIAWHIGRGLSTPDKAQLKTLPADVREREEKERLSRHRILLRVATELWLVGALRSLDDVVRPEDSGKPKENSRPNAAPTQKQNGTRTGSSDAEPFPLEVLKDLTGQDSQHTNLPLMVQWIKVFSWDLLGKKSADEDPTAEVDEPLVDDVMQQRFKNVLTQYYENAVAHLQKDQSSLNSQQKRNAEAYVRSGEVFEDRQANFDRQLKAQERFLGNMQVLSEALDLSMPDLSDHDAAGTTTDGNVGIVKAGEYLRGEGDGAGIWEDEEERRFYENITDLKTRVPSTLLDEPKKKKGDGEEQVGKRTEDKIDAEKAESLDDANDKSTTIVNQSVGAQVDALLGRLPDLMTSQSVDEVAYDFCYVNSKASRNRLIKTMQEVPRGRTDLLPLYGRLVATLGKYMPDIPQTLVSYLDDEFRSLQRRKQKDTLGSVRTNNIRYLAELTKFGLVAEHIIFHCLKISLDEFSKMNIEIICNLLENCGRYLVRNPETAPRMTSFLETLQRKKAAQHLGQQERMLIENAMYYVNPPERAAIQQKERSPIDLFVRKLIYLELTKRNIEKIAKQIRKLHWEEQEVVHILHKVFVKPHNIKYSNIHFLAIILGALNRYHQDFAISVVDDLLENITLGLEDNDFKFNQRRISEVRYLGELYVYRMVDSSIIFDTLFKITTFGHGGWPRPENFSPLDPPDDFFRVRLICTLLESCGGYYEKGAAKKKLDFFLTFFQYYIRTKESLPMDVEFDLQDVFALIRPQLKIIPTLEEAGAAFAEACKEQYQMSAPDRPSTPLNDEELDGPDGAVDLDGRGTPDLDDKSSEEDEAEPGDHEAISTPELRSDDDEEEHIIVRRPQNEIDPEEEADFEREFAKMMAESQDTRRADKRPIQEISLPVRRGPHEANADGSDQPDGMTTKFALLSRKGNKPQTRAIDLPSSSSFAVAMKTQQEAERAEQQRIKRLVLNYDSTRDDDDSTPNGVQPSSHAERVNPIQAAIASSWPSLDASSHESQKPAAGRSMGRRHQTRRLDLKDVDWT